MPLKLEACRTLRMIFDRALLLLRAIPTSRAYFPCTTPSKFVFSGNMTAVAPHRLQYWHASPVVQLATTDAEQAMEDLLDELDPTPAQRLRVGCNTAYLALQHSLPCGPSGARCCFVLTDSLFSTKTV